MGNGFDTIAGVCTYLNTAYLTWAGITAGKAQSFYSFTGGGDNWANLFSPDRKGFNEPDLLAYTASFGGGFSATISAESPGRNGSPAAAPDMTGASGSTSTALPVDHLRRPDAGPTSSARCTSSRAGARPGVRRSHNVNVKDYGYYDTIG